MIDRRVPSPRPCAEAWIPNQRKRNGLKPLAFIIITYDRPQDMLALARNIASLDGAEELLEEVVVLNNDSKEDYSEVEEYMRSQQRIPFRYISSAVNLGVSRGRNRAFHESKAPFLIMLDDDAELQNADSLLRLLPLFETPCHGRPVAVVSFKVLYHETGEMQRNAFPHKKFEKYRGLSSFATSYYAGGAHAVRREAMEKAGLYPEDFFYGMEEYDMAYRLIDAGYSIMYSDSVVMLHKESPKGRQPKREKLRMMWVNKTVVAWRYLPLHRCLSTAFLWSLEYLRKSGFDLRGWLEGWRSVFGIPYTQRRMPVDPAALAYLSEVEARLSH